MIPDWLLELDNRLCDPLAELEAMALTVRGAWYFGRDVIELHGAQTTIERAVEEVQDFLGDPTQEQLRRAEKSAGQLPMVAVALREVGDDHPHGNALFAVARRLEALEEEIWEELEAVELDPAA